MRNLFVSLAACAVPSLLAAPLCLAAENQEPKPGPEHKKLGYFVGQWKMEGEWKPGAMGPGGKVTATDKCEWFEGGYSVVCHSQGTNPMGPSKSIGILGYSMEDKAYTYTGVDNSAMTFTSVPHGTVQGDTWVYTDEGKMGGQMMKTKVTIKELSPTAYTFKMETAGSDGKWTTMMESKSTKVP